MPELPEVEVTRRSFADRIASAQILALRMGKPLRWPLGVLPQSLVGRYIFGVRRRGKYLLLDLDQGLLLLHLGMSGSLNFSPTQPDPGPHDHMDLVCDRGVLRLHDPRRFGAVVWAPSEDSPQAQKLLGRLGVEPLDGQFDVATFAQALKKRQSPIKQVLLAGDVVVGVGNIYASETLFLAGIRPTTRASRLTGPRVARLHAAIVQVLNRAVAQGGSSLKDFVNAEGRTGYFQLEAAVYGRAGEPCRVCASPIKSMVQGQRTTFYCTQCQKP
ncbi:bifunctional DNA-formamidopyrimidine glycosylase/DNA-(apurinic or apyrimidinic site) lyase [uncultured Limnohabitans sp.]|jgi:formamidopyrimidine-DNA glycosylase|uniref:bifunctional DNA-formamidopyrimidine glycosylase/DNA-(apurinic or apyrimidinic site) lyase n=1 Tax=uncultured Limnohabitans sp. TaxID=768543 RepID=UPI00260AED9F|nr:bifunctional DNA-formamidopyrimidine glycosylase/DNA-(apurinic or apyrimidinic site) lyase [uncultured Limnohabitans sp.]